MMLPILAVVLPAAATVNPTVRTRYHLLVALLVQPLRDQPQIAAPFALGALSFFWGGFREGAGY